VSRTSGYDRLAPMTAPAPRRFLLALWIVLVGGALALVLFHRDLLRQVLDRASSVSIAAAGAVYLLVGAVRGFTLIPSTTLVLVAVTFFPPALLFALTLAGILISSTSIYFFSEALGLDEVLKRRHPHAVARLTTGLQKYELPVIIGWSFFPLAPTDLICYVCGVLRVNFLKCLIGVAIGEGTICAIYIFAGDQALRWMGVK
jgi:uncharacterized membrane protein YdjX (TVP38/TMEM64 family)